MKRNWKQFAGAFLMGVLMPGLALHFGSLLTPARGQQEAPPNTEPDYTLSTQVPEGQAVMIPVRMPGGTVRRMELETYLIGVVLAEMPVDFEMEALKAQAVVARTFSLRTMQTVAKHSGAVCTDSKCCQAYMTVEEYLADGGLHSDVDKVKTAVLDTGGQVLTYEGELIEATYFSCSGGRTEDAAAVWGEAVPYLQSVESPGEEWAATYSHTVTFSADEFAARLGRSLSGAPKDWFGVTTYTEGGGVATMVIGGMSYIGTRLRELLELNSTAFTVTAEGNTITVTTSGRGHRVGMSQYGADAMAVRGSTYEQILAYYYQGTRIDKMDAVGYNNNKTNPKE